MSAPLLLALNDSQLLRVLRRAGYTSRGALYPFGPGGCSLRIARDGHEGGVIVTQAEHDGVEWLHASIAYADRMPAYDDLAVLHRAVFGRRRWAYQVFAPESEHVNVHEFALHLWGRADGAPALPLFAQGGSI